MTTDKPQTPQDSDHLRVVWTSNTLIQVILFWLIAIGVVMGVVSSFKPEGFDWRGLGGNLSTELIGAAITFFMLEWVIGRKREEEKETEDTEELKARLIRELGSRVHDVAINATEELNRHGWLKDGSLQGADLNYANLQRAHLGSVNLRGADLSDANLQRAFLGPPTNLQRADLFRTNLQGAGLTLANLQGAHLREANLQGTHLSYAKLQGANLWFADLEGASLYRANLEGARLWYANLKSADLREANLQGAHFWYANLEGADLRDAKFDENTVLPDSDYDSEREHSHKWTPDTNMSHYTDPNHPDFWRPESGGSVWWYLKDNPDFASSWWKEKQQGQQANTPASE